MDDLTEKIAEAEEVVERLHGEVGRIDPILADAERRVHEAEGFYFDERKVIFLTRVIGFSFLTLMFWGVVGWKSRKARKAASRRKRRR